MGSLRFFNLQPLMETFGCRTLFETGTGLGDGVHFASCYAFDAIRPVEIHPDIAGAARGRFAADPRVHILDETSDAALARALSRIERDRPRPLLARRAFPRRGLRLCRLQGRAGRRPAAAARTRARADREAAQALPRHDPRRRPEHLRGRPLRDGSHTGTGADPAARGRNIDFVTRGPVAATHDVQRFHPRTGYLVLTPKRTG